MSVDIDWKTLTTGPEGLALAESVRDFIHAKFQQVKLPKFIRTVQVHAFEFGDQAPTVVLKDVCDPLDEFYESDDESDLDDGGASGRQSPCEEQVSGGAGRFEGKQVPGSGRTATTAAGGHTLPQDDGHGSLQSRRGLDTQHQLNTSALSAHDRMSAFQQPAPMVSAAHTQRPGALRSLPSFVDQLASPLLNSRSGTPGIPGGTANLSYFHHTPFSHHPGHHHQSSFPAPWSDYNFGKPGLGAQENQGGQLHFGQIHRQHHQSSSPQLQPLTALGQHQQHQSPEAVAYSAGDPSTRPSTATTQTPLSRVPTGTGSQQDDSTPPRGASSKPRKGRRSSRAQAIPSSPPPLPSPGLSGPSTGRPEPNPQDMQLVLHVRYSGGIRLSLSAEILLDYPMSSFVSIPLQLTITGITFDGVAILAHVRPPFEVEKARNEALALEREVGGAESGEQQQGSKGRAHICFLSPEDANALLGAEDVRDLTLDNPSPADTPESPTDANRNGPSRTLQPASSSGPTLVRESAASPILKQATTYAPAGGDGQISGPGEDAPDGLGGLLREIRVESEIGQRRDGQQSLRNVGKVEKFVVEQVRRIFEDEFVWPSFWTFLL